MAMGPVPPFDAMARRVRRLAKSGVQSFWWPDHLMAFHSRELWATGQLSSLQPDPHVYADPFISAASSAEAAGAGLIGVCVTDAIRRSPATLVQTAMSLDHLAPGRVVLGLGAGEYANYGPYGIDVPSPTAVLEKAASQIRGFLADGGPDENGAVVGIRPPANSPGPQFWIAAHGPRGLRTAGRFGDGWIPNFLTVDEWSAGRRSVWDAAEEAGRNPETITYGLSVQVVLQDDHASAVQLLHHPILKAFSLLLPSARFEAVGSSHPLGGTGLSQLVATRLGVQQLKAAELVPVEIVAGQMLHGTAEEVANAIKQYPGLDHVVLWDPVPLVDLDAGRTSIQLCTEVARLLQEEDRK